MKIHVGCGSVYLKDYVNVDVPDTHIHLAADRPDLIERWRTTSDAYYARHKDKTINSLRVGPQIRETVCDRYGWFERLPFQNESVDELLSRQVFEHFSYPEAEVILKEVFRVMRFSGLVRISVPDLPAALDKLRLTQDFFYVRHILGPRNSDRGYHCVGYSKEALVRLFEQNGFRCVGDDENPHDLYPSIAIKFLKVSDED